MVSGVVHACGGVLWVGGGPIKRNDTMDTLVDSSWYLQRYAFTSHYDRSVIG